MPRRLGRGCRKWQGHFHDRGFRWTVPREAILSILETEEGFLSAEEVFFRLKKHHPEVGLTTVYRTLGLLEKLSLASAITGTDGKIRYSILQNDEEAGHHHVFVCSKCSTVYRYSDFTDEEKQLFRQMEFSLEKKFGFSVHRHEVRFEGYCDKCRNK